MLDWWGERLGAEAYGRVPTLCWISSSDTFLHLLCGTGTLVAVYACVFPFACWPWLLLWALYLSLAIAGQDFLGFQWDVLLLEIGFIATFLAPLAFRPSLRLSASPSFLVLGLYRWLLFRFMLLSGLVKIASRDAVWLDLSALEYHYMTQPLPPCTAWYIDHIPSWFHKASCGFMFFIELAVPFLIFMPRFFRLLGTILLIAFQLVIIASGNYGFFNLLTIILCLLLIDDHCWRQLVSRLRKREERDVFVAPRENYGDPIVDDEESPSVAVGLLRPWPRWALVPVLALLFFLSLPPTVSVVLRTFRQPTDWLLHLEPVERIFRPFRTVNGYGLFANMTEERPEIVIEGSTDGQTWKAYEFKHKPGDMSRAPGFVAPYMPRLDWQMWFAALNPNPPPWFGSLCHHLLLGTPNVLELIGSNPFPEKPPLALRAILYRYDFTSSEESQAEGHWWKRERLRMYLGPMTLRGG